MRRMISIAKFFVVSIPLFGACVVLFENCQRREETVERAPAATYETPLDAASSAFKAGKIQMDQDSFQAGEVLIAVINNECLTYSTQTGLLSDQIYQESQDLENLDVQSYKWVLPRPYSLQELSEAANNDLCVIGLSKDGVMKAGALPNDALLGSELNFTAIGGSDTYGFFADPLRGARANVVVAIIDSGIDYTHVDLVNQLWRGSSNEYGYNFLTNDFTVFDDFGHGTAVAGILAAQANNAEGVAGVMGHNVQIMALKVQDSTGSAYISDIVRGIDYARSKSVDVINISMEGDTANASLQSALTTAATAGIFIAVAAGNSNKEISGTNFIVPAIYSAGTSGMMSVGSIDAYTSDRSSFSNYSTGYVEIAAPGSNGVYYTKKGGGYTSGSGTSYSSPLVAGAGALIISFFKTNGISYNAGTIENILLTTAVRKSNLSSYFYRGNTLDLRSVAQYLRRTYLTPVDGGFDEN